MMKMRNLLLFGTIVMCFVRVWAQEKKVITKAEDLPKHSYSLKNKDAIGIIKDKEYILALAARVKKDLLNDLETYDIRENATLREYYGNLRTIHILEGAYDLALDYLKKQRELAGKDSQKRTLGMEAEVLLRVVLKDDIADDQTIAQQINQFMEHKLSSGNFKVIQEDVESAKGEAEILSENFLMGWVKTEVQPALDNNTGEIPGDLVFRLIQVHYMLNYYIPYRTAFLEAYVNALEKNMEKLEKHNIWKERDALIKKNPDYAPVVIGIWDSGVDMSVFPKEKRWINEGERLDGLDTDGNGFVDDVYGIAYDVKEHRDPNYLHPLAHALKDKKKYQDHTKGLMDLFANIDSKEVSDLKLYMSHLKPEDFEHYMENLNLYSEYSHGTHVAGIAAAGNDLARILVVRNTEDHKNVPAPPDDAYIARASQNYGDIVDYLKQNQVKVVNMSWGVSYEDVLADLELNGIGRDDGERNTLAKTYFTKLYDAFEEALRSAPEILFVCAAGNSDDDVDFTADFPSSLNLPHLITVGAVDIEGKKASFTTEGQSVDIYANGYEVESFVPGGDRVAFSGTSMASPNVANLAAKMLAVDPDLTPPEVVEAILKTGTRSAEDEKVLLIHPKKAMEWIAR